MQEDMPGAMKLGNPRTSGEIKQAIESTNPIVSAVGLGWAALFTALFVTIGIALRP